MACAAAVGLLACGGSSTKRSADAAADSGNAAADSGNAAADSGTAAADARDAAGDVGADDIGTEGCGDAAACLERRHATWPMPNPASSPLPNPGRWSVGAETAVEALTGLEWQRASTAKLTWDQAVATCEALVAGGWDDWRLPARIELVSLVDFTHRPSIDPAAFGDTPEDYFWSGTATAFDPALAWSVYFGAGLTAYGLRAGPSAHVRCVRGGRVVSAERYQLDPDEAHDRNTGLRWKRAHHPDPLAWTAANDLCASVGQPAAGWRLPSSNEAQTIVDEARAAPAVDRSIFPGTPVGRFWTSTPSNRGNTGEGIYLDTRDGATEETVLTTELWVRCVR